MSKNVIFLYRVSCRESSNEMVRTSLHDILYSFLLGLDSAHFDHLWSEGAIILDHRNGTKTYLLELEKR